MKRRDFDDFLIDKFTKIITGTSDDVRDDDFPDAYDAWICDLSPDNWLEYGEEYKNECMSNLMKLINKENV